MVIYYFGADGPWNEQNENDIHRRNMAILLTLSTSEKVSIVYNVLKTTRKRVLSKKFHTISKNKKIKNIYVAPILPEKGFLKFLFKPFNKLALSLVYPHFFLAKKNSLSWCYWPKGYIDYKFLGFNNMMIFDTDHNIIDDPNIEFKDKAKREDILIKAGNEAKVILSGSRTMLEWYHKRNLNNTRLTLNGFFNSRINLSDYSEPKDFTVTYCGTLSRWMKVDWITRMAKEHTSWKIKIIGQNYKTTISQELKEVQNIELYGFLPANEILEIIKKSNVCIGLYNEHNALDGNSMKIYDYLSQGRPVVVNNYHPHLQKDFNNLIEVVNTFDEFIEKIKMVQTPDQNRVKLFLNTSSWRTRIDPILNQFNETNEM